jgi:hypothetical protein
MTKYTIKHEGGIWFLYEGHTHLGTFQSSYEVLDYAAYVCKVCGGRVEFHESALEA